MKSALFSECIRDTFKLQADSNVKAKIVTTMAEMSESIVHLEHELGNEKLKLAKEAAKVKLAEKLLLQKRKLWVLRTDIPMRRDGPRWRCGWTEHVV